MVVRLYSSGGVRVVIVSISITPRRKSDHDIITIRNGNTPHRGRTISASALYLTTSRRTKPLPFSRPKSLGQRTGSARFGYPDPVMRVAGRSRRAHPRLGEAKIPKGGACGQSQLDSPTPGLRAPPRFDGIPVEDRGDATLRHELDSGRRPAAPLAVLPGDATQRMPLMPVPVSGRWKRGASGERFSKPTGATAVRRLPIAQLKPTWPVVQDSALSGGSRRSSRTRSRVIDLPSLPRSPRWNPSSSPPLSQRLRKEHRAGSRWQEESPSAEGVWRPRGAPPPKRAKAPPARIP